MRSRYTAYARRSIDYIFDTYAATTQTQSSKQEISAWANSVTFVRLDVISASQHKSPPSDEDGYVEFSAHYLQDGLHHQLHEKSRFVRQNQQWRYIDGNIIPEAAIALGRNDPCPCLSGSKFKKCHGR